MVDRISGQNSSLQDAALLQAAQQGQVERVNKDTKSKAAESTMGAGYDKASISPEALEAWEKEKQVLKYSRQVQMTAPDVDYDKVNRIKNLVDSGRINDYLNTVDTNSLVESLLSSPAGALLR